MSDIINTIKGSKAIVVLLILYTLIAIIVIVLDSGSDNSSKTKSNNNSSNETSKAKEKFISSIQSLYNSVDEYVISNSIQPGECVLLDDILNDASSGSIKVVDTTEGVYKIWYNENGYYLNGAPLTSKKMADKYIDDEYSTKYYNTCGENE